MHPITRDPSDRRSPLMRARLLALPTVLLSAAVLTGCTSASGDAGSEKEKLVFAAVPSESSQSLESAFEPIGEVLEEATGREVEFQTATDYASVIEGQRAGQIDLAAYGPLSYVMAKDSGIDLQPAASPADEEDETPTYQALAYVTQDSDIESLDDVAGSRVCFVEAASTSGYLVPAQGLSEAGIDAEGDVEATMAGSHDSSLLSLESGQCDVAFAHDAMLTTLERTGQIEADALEPIWESEPIPADPIAMNLDTLDEETAEQVRTALTEKANKPAMVEAGICEDEESCELPEETEWGYVGVEDEHYDLIRRVCEDSDAEACDAIA